MNNEINRLLVSWLIQYNKEEEDKRRRTRTAFSHFRFRKKELSSRLSVQIENTSNKDMTKFRVTGVVWPLSRNRVIARGFSCGVYGGGRTSMMTRICGRADKKEERVKRVVSRLFHTYTRTRRCTSFLLVESLFLGFVLSLDSDVQDRTALACAMHNNATRAQRLHRDYPPTYLLSHLTIST